MSVADTVATTSKVTHTDTPPGSTTAETATDGAEAPSTPSVRDMTLKDIIAGIKRRRGANPMPSSVQRAANRRRKRRRAAVGLPEDETTSAPSQEAIQPQQEEEQPEEEVVAPQVTLDADGNIIIDQDSLVVSAGTIGAAGNDHGMATVESHAYNEHVTSASYAKRESAHKWEAAETEQFYVALRKFGTDFSLMESSFPKRSRRQLKLKFKREEKENPDRVDQALHGPPLLVSQVEENASARAAGAASESAPSEPVSARESVEEIAEESVEGAVVLDAEADSDDGKGSGEHERADKSDGSDSDSDSDSAAD